jgi:alkylhydroperoxidase family enzyme
VSELRLQPLTPAELDGDQRKLYDAVLASPRGQGPTRRFVLRDDETLTGPFDAFLRSPLLGGHLERAGMAFREDTVIPPAARELAILVVAKAWHADFEWWVHSMVAKGQGVPEEAIDAIGHGRDPKLEDPELAAAHDVAFELVHKRSLEASTLDRAKEALGERAVVELVTVVGFYQLVSGVLESFQPPPPSGDLEVVGPPR